MKKIQRTTTDGWESLKAFTAARIAMGRVGSSIPLKQSLEFQLAHAHARDAVYSALDVDALMERIKTFGLPRLALHSQAQNRPQYLQRPDYGRLLNDTSAQLISESAYPCDVCIIIADGLSATAVNQNALPLLEALLPMLNYKIAPICLAEQARVALGDPIAHGLQAKLSIMLIGERPGLSSADSMGAYLTFNPRPGLTDEMRNCISNIRPEGLPCAAAAQKIFYLVQKAFQLQLSGVNLKDNAGLLS
ncbi:ethanolamine ammonia-lyase subunit EutC [uncultured Mucilaginibacter sp.]|uniref:ethanolamine ammonia-lyase subunit EutC n=1 Tax=uncultured Mucilaginibacter sp. TaxID=797541 RepID=UPI0025D1F0FA|nr:ethanolamine ammonia-lyase subunit EutC [uncultured Mucilaginibacter sp.]